jgi:hypothetical protein
MSAFHVRRQISKTSTCQPRLALTSWIDVPSKQSLFAKPLPRIVADPHRRGAHTRLVYYGPVACPDMFSAFNSTFLGLNASRSSGTIVSALALFVRPVRAEADRMPSPLSTRMSSTRLHHADCHPYRTATTPLGKQHGSCLDKR